MLYGSTRALKTALLVMLGMVCNLTLPRPASAQVAPLCDGIHIVDTEIVPRQTEGFYSLGILVLLENRRATDVFDVELQVTLTHRMATYENVVLTVPMIPAGERELVESTVLVKVVPEAYEVTLTRCWLSIPHQLGLLHAADRAEQQAAVESFVRVTVADVPTMLAILGRHTADDEAGAQAELVEDLMLAGTLARLNDARAVPALLNCMGAYRGSLYQAAYERLLADFGVAPVPLLVEGRRQGLSLEQVVHQALVGLGPGAALALAEAAVERGAEEGGDTAAQALRDIVQAAPEVLLQQEDEGQRLTLIQALGSLPDPSSADLLLQTAAAYPGTREEAISLVAAMGPTAAGTAASALDNPEAGVRESAVLVLLAMNPSIAVPAVEQEALEHGVTLPAGMNLPQTLTFLADALTAEHATQLGALLATAADRLAAGDCQAAYRAVAEAYEVDHDLSLYHQVVHDVYVCLARMLLDGGEPEQATEILVEAVARQRDSDQVTGLLQYSYVAWASQRLGAGDLEQADALLQSAAALGASDGVVARWADVKLSRGEAALEGGRWPEAQEFYVQAHDLAPGRGAVRDALGVVVARRNVAYLVLGLAAVLVTVIGFALRRAPDPRL